MSKFLIFKMSYVGIAPTPRNLGSCIRTRGGRCSQNGIGPIGPWTAAALLFLLSIPNRDLISGDKN